MSPELIGLLEKLIALASLAVSSYAAYVMLQVKKTVDPLPKAIDGAKQEVIDLKEEVARLKGEDAGQAREKATQAIKDAATVAALASIPAQTSLPTSPSATLETKTDAPVSVSIVPNDEAPVPVIVKVKGITQSIEPPSRGHENDR